MEAPREVDGEKPSVVELEKLEVRIRRAVSRLLFVPVDEVEEIVARVMLKALRAGGHFQWIWVKHEAISGVKRSAAKRKALSGLATVSSQIIGPCKQTENSEYLNKLFKVARMSPLERRVLYLRFYESKTIAELKAYLGMGHEQVSGLLSSALEALRKAEGVLKDNERTR